MRGQRLITQLLLLFALLAGQHFALVHAVSHIPHREAGGKEPGPPARQAMRPVRAVVAPWACADFQLPS